MIVPALIAAGGQEAAAPPAGWVLGMNMRPNATTDVPDADEDAWWGLQGGSSVYPQTLGPNNLGHSNSTGLIAGSAWDLTSATGPVADARLGGDALTPATISQFRFDLPPGGGDNFVLYCACGSTRGSSSPDMQFFADLGLTQLITRPQGALSGDQFRDAANNIWTTAAWPANNVGVAFTAAADRVVIMYSAKAQFIAHIRVEQV